MNTKALRPLRKKRIFTPEDLADLLKIRFGSAKVLCSRYVRKGLFIRLKRNAYALEENWDKFSQPDFFKIANFLQVPSYVSLLTALAYYDVSTQVQRNFYESISLKRSMRFDIQGTAFSFYKIKAPYYFDFRRTDEGFIAAPEKALVDALYLYSFGKYKLDFSALDLVKLNRKKIKEALKIFPAKTKKLAKKLCNL